MLFGIFKKRDDSENLKNEVKQAFSAVKQDISKAAEWITHLNNKHKTHENKIRGIDSRLSTIENELEDIKNFMNFFSTRMNSKTLKQLSKQEQTAVYKQTAVEGVQTPVQTGVQTAFLGHLSVMERAIVWVLANTNQKLSCEDISVILNKERSTVRGQLNSIRQKNEDLISENMEKNGKKRFFIDDNIKEMIVSRVSQDVRVKGRKIAK